MKTITDNAANSTSDLPSDLRLCVGARVLIELSLDAVQVLVERLPHLNGAPDTRHSPRMLLTLLTYCYASGIYSSEDIEWACRSNSAARYICANTNPDWETIRGFRRANRPWIEECLARVYVRACGAKLAERGLGQSPVGEPDGGPSVEVIALVRRKIALAVMMDTAASE